VVVEEEEEEKEDVLFHGVVIVGESILCNK
jgi:hypothetical protein